MKQEETQISYYKPQICWDCKNACGGCSWSDSLTPVDGWDAVPSEHMAGSYHIISCPQFESDTETDINKQNNPQYVRISKSVSEADKKEMYDMRKCGMPITKIAIETHHSTDTVSRTLEEAKAAKKTKPQKRSKTQNAAVSKNVKRTSRKRGKRLTYAERKKICDLRKQGVKTSEIAKEVNCTIVTVNRILKQAELLTNKESKNAQKQDKVTFRTTEKIPCANDFEAKIPENAASDTDTRGISPQKRAEIVGLKKRGTTLQLIHELTGVNKTMIEQILKEEIA